MATPLPVPMPTRPEAPVDRCLLLGASHLTAILRASRAPGPGPALPVFGDRAPAFQGWAVDPAVLPGHWSVASLYLGHTAPFWGPTAVALQPGHAIGICHGLQALLRSIPPASETAALVLSLRGEEFHNLALSAGEHPFEFHLPERADLGFVPGLPVLPAEVVESRMAAALAQTFAMLSAVRMFCPHHRILRLTPPPPAADAALQRWLARHARDGHAVSVHPATVRLKLWTLQARLLDQASTALGVTSLAPPSETLDALGLLREACMDDPVHGNAAYGAAVCRQLAERLRDVSVATAPTAEETADASV